MSARQSLRDRLDAAKKKLHHDVPIQRVSPPIMVRYRPVIQGEAEKLNEAGKRDKRDDSTVRGHARLLAQCCMGIWMLDDDNLPVSVLDPVQPVHPGDGGLPDFGSADLAELIETSSAEETVRRLYATDGDVIVASLDLQDWSGQQVEAIDEDQDKALHEG